jgi:CII-binding regulator of phage lambda lysogenization HflD
MKEEGVSKLLETFSQQDKDLRLLTYKILVETFNKKYSTALNQKQKSLLENFINNMTNTTGFVDYYKKELVSTVANLKQINEKICDRVTKIKLNETIKVLESTKVNKVVSDESVSMLMLTYELIKELGDKLNEK